MTIQINRHLLYNQLIKQVEAMQREKQLKGWTRAKKEALVSGDIKKLKKL
jgi:predicted GIY-YIG superfamily endonuclease